MCNDNEHTLAFDGEIDGVHVTIDVPLHVVLDEATEADLVAALIEKDYSGEHFLETAEADELWEALEDKDTAKLVDLLERNNELERAARRWLDSLSPTDLRSFLVQHAYVPRPPSELTFVTDNPSDAVHWVQVLGPQYTVGMILPDLSNLFEGRAKLRMFTNTADDSGWIDCDNLPKAQRLARMLYAGRGAVEVESPDVLAEMEEAVSDVTLDALHRGGGR